MPNKPIVTRPQRLLTGPDNAKGGKAHCGFLLPDDYLTEIKDSEMTNACKDGVGAPPCHFLMVQFSGASFGCLPNVGIVVLRERNRDCCSGGRYQLH
jgi:hypothetical protein